jgi:hypothetical protein
MPIQVDIDKSRGLITTRASGEVLDADFIAMEDLFAKSPDFSRSFARLCDLTQATDMNVSEALMKRWAEDPVMDRSARHAIVCTDPVVMTNVLQFIRESRSHPRRFRISDFQSGGEVDPRERRIIVGLTSKTRHE